MQSEIWDQCPICGERVDGLGAYSHCAKRDKINLDSFIRKIEDENFAGISDRKPSWSRTNNLDGGTHRKPKRVFDSI